jgi:thymidylate synthase
MNNIDKQYQNLLQYILDNGVEKDTRNGKVLSVFGRTIRYKFEDGKFPLLTTKKMAFKTIVTELLWFLTGQTNIKYLVDNNCHIWDGDCYQAYIKRYNKGEHIGKTKLLENSKKNRTLTEPFTQEEFIDQIKTDIDFAKKWGELGPIYGKQWRSWRVGKGVETTLKTEDGQTLYEAGSMYIDQIQNLINDLKTNPDSRRLMVSAWNVGELDQMVLPPCHYGFQVYTRELSDEERLSWMKQNRSKTVLPMRDPNVEFSMDEFFRPYGVPKRAISLMFNMRSTDVGLGLGFNLASYGLLLMMIAKQVNMVPDELIYNGGDVHLYKNHIEPIKEQLNREPYMLPIVKLSDRVVNDISEYTLDDIVLENYQSHPTIKMPLSN